MASPTRSQPFELAHALLEAYAVNERTNQHLLAHLDDQAWRAEPSGGKGRTIAATFAHIHNVRHMWLEVSAKGTKIPAKLDRNTCTRKQAMAALAKSAEAIGKLLAAALAHPDGRVKDFRPDVAGFSGYAVAHEAHHRGQICMLARQVGHPRPGSALRGVGMGQAVARVRVREVILRLCRAAARRSRLRLYGGNRRSWSMPRQRELSVWRSVSRMTVPKLRPANVTPEETRPVTRTREPSPGTPPCDVNTQMRPVPSSSS